MEEEIIIGHTPGCEPVDRDETKYQTDIIATSSMWRESLEVDYTLQQSPFAGQTCIVTLNQPVKFSLHMHLWLFYDCPLAYYNGYENENEIEQAGFCFGEITKIISYNEAGATIEFTVSKVLTLQDILRSGQAIVLPKFWTDFFMEFLKKGKYSLESLGKYFKLTVSAESDLGQTCIFTEYENEWVICLLKEWCFNEDCTFGGKYLLPENIRKLILPGK
jgi:hypothetical protein